MMSLHKGGSARQWAGWQGLAGQEQSLGKWEQRTPPVKRREVAHQRPPVRQGDPDDWEDDVSSW